MNLLHMKYAVEIAEAKSINRASETLFVGQPTLSRAIKELEQNLGIKIFDRSAKGMFLTPDGEVFIRYAKAILKQVDEVEAAFRRSGTQRQRFSLSCPRASYISDAFTAFSLLFKPSDAIDAFYYETNSANTVKNVMQEDYRLGIVRYAAEYDKYYKDMLEEKNLAYELVAEFRYVLVAGRNSSLARAGSVKFNTLKDYIEIAHADPYVPSMPFAASKKEELPDNSNRRIFVYERGSQFELLSRNSNCFMWVSPIPQETLDRFNLVEIPCNEELKIYKDLLVHRKDYSLSSLDRLFIAELCASNAKSSMRTDKIDIYSFKGLLQNQVIFAAAPFFLEGQLGECRTLHFPVQAKRTHAESVIFEYVKQTCSGFFVVLGRLFQAVFGSNSAFRIVRQQADRTVFGY